MKLHSIALAALAFTAGTAHAAPAVNVDAAGTVRIYMSGASALRNTIAGLVFNDICGGTNNTSTTVYNMTQPATSTGTPAAQGNDWAITCALPAAFNGIPAGTQLAFFKSDQGGSGQGVFPVYFQTGHNFVEPANLANCTGTTVADRQYLGCPVTRSVAPQVGVSDVEPGMFKGINVPTDDPTYPVGGLSASQIAELQVKAVVQTVFGVAVNKALYEAMQVAQSVTNVGSTADADQPTLSRVLATSYFNGSLAFPSDGLGWQPLVGTSDAKAATQVNVCRRVPGSGTQAAANALLLSFPCGSGPLAPVDNTNSDPAAANDLNGVATGGTLFVYEGSGTANVVNCLNQAQTVGAYAIGHVSKENAPGASDNWRHVKLDGVSPNRDNAKSGKYDYLFESTIQYKKTVFNALTQNQKNFITGFIAEAAKPNALAKLSAAAQQGVIALPGSYAGAFGTGTANEIAFGSRVSRGGNSCTPLTVQK